MWRKMFQITTSDNQKMETDDQMMLKKADMKRAQKKWTHFLKAVLLLLLLLLASAVYFSVESRARREEKRWRQKESAAAVSASLRQCVHGARHRFYFITFYGGKVSKSIHFYTVRAQNSVNKRHSSSGSRECILAFSFAVYNKYKLHPISSWFPSS